MTHNNQWKGAFWSVARVADLRRLIEVDGATLTHAGKYFNTSRSAVKSAMDRYGVVSRNLPNDNRSRLKVFPPFPIVEGPSPAALRLAQFDPIVRRAVNERLGIVCDAVED